MIVTQDRRISLDNLYRSGSPGRAVSDDAIQSFLQGALSDPSEARPASFQKVRPLLRPQLTPKDYIRSRNLKGALVYEPSGISDDLLVAYVLDEPTRFSYVRPDDLQKWNTTIKEIRQIAMANLAGAHDALDIEPGRHGNRVAYVLIDARDGYAATRALLPSIQEMIGKMLGSTTFNFAIPNRNFMVAWRLDYAKAEEFKAQIRQDFASRPHPLSRQIFRLEGGRITISD